MKKPVKVILTIIAVVFCIGLIGTGVIFGIIMYNNNKYGNAEPIMSYDVTDISQYPTELYGIDVKHVDNGSFQGFHFIPENKLYKGIIVCYGGSEGSPFFEVAQQYAEEGYETLAVFMFGMKNQPKELVKVPLEQFEDVLDYINNNIEDGSPITVMAASKGAEYALNLAARYNEISNVILLAPVAYSFSGLSSGDTSSSSSWTWKDEEVPFVDIQKASGSVIFNKMIFPMITGAPVCFKDIYNAALEADNEKDNKLIPAQNVKANILMIVGEDDQMMNTYEMAKLIQSQNDNAVLHSYKNAGHIFSGDGVAIEFDMRIRLGGDIDGNRRASEECATVINDFLSSHHGK